MLTVELEFINPFAVTSFTRLELYKNEDSHSLKGTDGPEFRRYLRKKADDTARPSCLVSLPQSGAPP